MGELLEKSVSIARSGVQKYLRRELPALKVGPIPTQHADKKEFHVYRSAPLIADSADLFTRKPFIYTHKAYVNPENFTDLVQGWTGDDAVVEMNEAKTEVVIRTPLTIGGEEAIEAFKGRGEREVSPLYFGKFEWKDGVAPDGQPYEIEMTELSGVNHVALVPAGRGGSDAAILDHLEKDQGFLTGLWRTIRRFISGVQDELPETFRIKLTELAKLRGSLTEDQMNEKACVLWDCIADIPYTDDLGLLQRFLGDIKGLVGADDKEAEAYVSRVSDLYEKLDKLSLDETLNKEEKDMAKSADEMAKEEEEKKKAASADADKEWDDLAAKMKEHREAGGKASDWKMGKSKDADDDESDKKDEADKERVKETKDKEKAEAKDEDEDEKDKDKKDEKKEEKAKSEDGFSADAYGAPWSMTLGPRSTSGEDPALKVLGKMGFGPGKEKK
jgi:hypothetical protein